MKRQFLTGVLCVLLSGMIPLFCEETEEAPVAEKNYNRSITSQSIEDISYTIPDLRPAPLFPEAQKKGLTKRIVISAAAVLAGTGFAMYSGYEAYSYLGGDFNDPELQSRIFNITQGMVVAGVSGLFLNVYLDSLFQKQPTSPE